MTRKDKGFTIIELMVVVLVLGILATIALTKFGTTRDKATLAGLRSDLGTTELAEETYFADHGGYATLPQLQANGFTASPGTVISIVADSGGYTVHATNSSISTAINACMVQVGAGAPMSADGVISCP